MIDNENRQNILATKLNEIKDFPYEHKLKIYGVGSLLGEECLLGEKQLYSTSLTCVSSKGALMKIHKKLMHLVKYYAKSWMSINTSVL